MNWLHRGGDDPALAEALADAQRPRGCSHCGRTYVGSAAFTVHRDGGSCLPGDAYGQLVERDGTWHLLGSSTARN